MVKCNTLEEVRVEIDKLDDKLVEMISERTRLISQASTFKNSVEEVKNDERIDYILQKVRKKAIELNISPNMVSELFTIMIDDMVETEISEFRNKQIF